MRKSGPDTQGVAPENAAVGLEEMLRLASSRSPVLRESAIEGLAELAASMGKSGRGLVAVRGAVRSLTADGNEAVRIKATETLGWVGGSADLPVLRSLVGDKSWAVRASAYSALAQLGRRCALPLIQQGFSDKNPVVRKYAAVAAYDLVGCAARELLNAVTSRYLHPLARPGYLYVAAKCGDSDATRELEALAYSTEPRISEPARDILEEVRGSSHLHRVARRND